MALLKIDDFSGGLYASASASDVPDNYCHVFKGVARYSNKTMQTRFGSQLITSPMNAHSMFYYSPYWYYGVSNQLYRNNSSGFVYTFGTTGKMRFSVMPSAPGFSEYLYVCNSGGCRAVTNSSSRQWGINPPTIAPTAVGGGAGQLTADAIYRYAFTYYNGSTGCESNPSPIEIINLSPSQTTVGLSGIQISTDSQVTQKRIYRSLGNGGILYYRTSIAASQQNFTDTASDASLSDDLLSYYNTVPLQSFSDCQGPWNNAMFWLLGSSGRIYYSRQGYPESVEGYLNVSTNSDSLQRLAVFGGDLFAISRYNVFQVFGDNQTFGNTSYFVRKLSGIVGTKQPDTVVVTPKGIVWQSYDGIRIFTGGSQSVILGEEAMRNLFNGYDPFVYYDSYATYTHGEYIIGNGYKTYGINLESGKLREIGVAISAIHHDLYIDTTAYTKNGAVYKLEASGYHGDGGDQTVFDIRTKVYSFEVPVRIESIRVGATVSSSDTYTVTLFAEGTSKVIGTLNTAVGFSISDFDIGSVVKELQIRIDCTNTNGTSTINWIEVEYYPIELRIIGDDPVKIPATYEADQGTLAFNFHEQELEDAGALYKYELINVDYATGSATTSLLYTKAAGSNHTITTLSSPTRTSNSHVLNFMGPLDRIYFIGNISNLNFHPYDTILQRSRVKMRINFGDSVVDVPGYINSAYTNIRFRIVTRERKSLEPVYLYERITVIGNPNSNGWNVYIDMLNESPVFVGSDSQSFGTTFQYEVNKMGILDEVYMTGTFTDVASYLNSLELVARPITMTCRFGDQTFEVPGHMRDGNTGIKFDLREVPAASLDSLWFFERIAYDVNTGGNDVTFTLTFMDNLASTTLGPFSDGSRTANTANINRIGRLLWVDVTFEAFNASALYQFEIIAVPLVLDLYLDDQHIPVPAYLAGDSDIYFDLKNISESTIQQVYLFERFLIDGDTNGYNVYPYIHLIEQASYDLIGVFFPSDRSVTDYTINSLGRLDALRLNSTWGANIALYKLELIAHAVVLEIHINGQLAKKVPGRFRSYGQELFFEIYAYLQESLQTSYVVDRFFYDVLPNSQAMLFELQIIGASDITVLNTSAASRTIGEFSITTPGRPSNLTITSDFTQFLQSIYRMELHITATNRMGMLK